jgi:hypothetical protein
MAAEAPSYHVREGLAFAAVAVVVAFVVVLLLLLLLVLLLLLLLLGQMLCSWFMGVGDLLSLSLC